LWKGAPKAKIKDIAIQISLMFIEIEKQDIIREELIKGMNHRICIKSIKH